MNVVGRWASRRDWAWTAPGRGGKASGAEEGREDDSSISSISSSSLCSRMAWIAGRVERRVRDRGWGGEREDGGAATGLGGDRV